jgi:hypothetical protein
MGVVWLKIQQFSTSTVTVEIQSTGQLSDTLIYSDRGFLQEKAWPKKAILDSSWCRPVIERSSGVGYFAGVCSSSL